MLKAIELVGFKSFADKSRFEFPQGITVIVGPNGSGKSNVVDALKWVLGEQSAKSLRGKDMTDVIFKGTSGEGGRKPANAAEATVILDNSARQLPFDTDEVHITRRVYRSGEGEYQINRESCRLKDIKNLFRGTGVGTDAYSLIEQGKVDQLLQASANDRRAIFEEAAGISRFKAKKIESERRLLRVEHNLVRLADIVEEVGSRYRSVKAQASKAVRYKEYSDRMRVLRTYVGSLDYSRLNESLQQISGERTQLQEHLQNVELQLEKNQKLESELLSQISQRSEAAEEKQSSYNQFVQSISSLESIVSSNEARKLDLTERIEGQSQHLAKLLTRQNATIQRVEEHAKEFEKAELEFDATKSRLQSTLTSKQEISDSLNQLKSAIAEKQAEIDAHSQKLNKSEKKRESENAKRESEIKAIGKCKETLGDLQSKINEAKSQFSKLNETITNLQNQAESKDTSLKQTRQQLEDATARFESAKINLEDNLRKQVGMSQRADVIQELEERLEGVNVGVKKLLSDAQQATNGPLSEIIGMVADLLQVNVQHAALVDLALGEATQFIVVDGDNLVDAIAQDEVIVKGRTGILSVGAPCTLNAEITDELSVHSGVIGRLDSLVQVTEGAHKATLELLLSGTWVVRDLTTALDLFDSGGHRVRFVTLNNQIIESDGTILIGPRDSSSGLISRRSELRALQRELHDLETTISNAQRQLDITEQEKKTLDEQFQETLSEQTEISAQIADETAKLEAVKQQLQIYESQFEQNSNELNQIEAGLKATDGEINSLDEMIAECTQAISNASGTVASNNEESDVLSKTLIEQELEITSLKVKLAKCEQQLDDWGERQNQSTGELTSIKQDIEKINYELSTARDGVETAERQIAESRSKLDVLCQQRDELKNELDLQSQQRRELDQQRQQYSEQINQSRSELDKVQSRFHQAEIQQRQWKLELDQLCTRILDDYGIEISSVTTTEPEELPEDRKEIDETIEQLRRKISNIGAVNMDAVNELEELEQRFNHLNSQYEDMVSAKGSLERLIHRINGECRKLYVDTLDTIRTNFQELFRKTFGGGRADIILEEGVDPLEAGVELVATPPGKTSFNNSLLSGGEKAMTAVALLMAIFQFRPSPFCVLDEVDAPFDEANIGRFLDVLKSFLSWTKFVIVTHSKKTMTAADTLYGVTMQESGVSHRVSVRFEDVSEDGAISPGASERTTGDDDSQRGVA